MATQDTIIYHPLQKPTSADLNDAQSLIARELMNALRYINATTVFGAAAPPATTTRNVVLNGLTVIPNGNDVSVAPGVLCQNSSSITPTPGALDSSYRLGQLLTPATVAMPSPVVDSWVLIEAQVLAATATATVEFLDPASKNFVPVPTTTRQQTIGIQFQTTTTAGSIPAFTGSEWVPIAAVFRPTSGGAVSAADIIDLRPMQASRQPHGNQSVPAAVNALNGGRRGAPGMFSYDSGVAKLVAETFSTSGDRIWFSGEFDPTDSAIQTTGLSYAADTWYYVYLTPWRTQYAPINAQGLPLNTQACGLLVISDVAPVDGLNGSALSMPAPFDVSANVITKQAVCVAALRRNSGNTDFVTTYSTDGREFVLAGTSSQPSAISAASLTPPVLGNNAIVPTAGATPACASAVLASFTYNGGAGSPANIRFSIEKTGSSIGTFDMGILQDDINQIVRVEIPRALFGSDDYTVVFNNAPDAASTLSIRYYGWRM